MDEVVKVEVFVPAGLPFTNQAYDGLPPPLVMTALKVTEEPEQMDVPGLALMDIVGVTLAFTVSVTV